MPDDSGNSSQDLRDWQATFDAANDVIWILDKNHRIVRSNKAAGRLFGLETEDLVGKHCFEVAHGTPGPIAKCPMPRARKSLSRESMELEIGERFFLVTVDPILDSRGNFDGAVHIISDITEYKKTEEALRKERDRAQMYLDLAGVMFVAIDTEGTVTLINRKGCEVLGCARDEIIGVKWFDKFVAAGEREKIKTIFGKLMSGEIETPGYHENPIITANGEERIIAWHNTILKDEAGNIIGTLSSGGDITARKLAEQEREKLQEQLIHSQKMESVGRLAGGVAHDFNNLLTVIENYADFVAEGLGENDPLRDDLRQIIEAGQKASGLTRQLLAFSRRQVMEPRIIDLNEIVADLQKMLERLIGEDIELRTVLAEDLGRVNADPGQVEQVLMNLAVNARDAMLGGGRLLIETANVDLGEDYVARHPGSIIGPHVMLAVSDNGQGMTEDVRQKIFEPFFTTKGLGRGTGLGLSTVYGIVRQTGGNIFVYSEPGEGTTFKVYLPLDEGEVSEQKPDLEPVDLRGTETIMVVEDEEAVLKLAKRILSSAGYKVIAAQSGDEALGKCEGHGGEIDLLLTDVVMPGMSGKELAGRLAAISPGLKVLYMSGYTDEAVAQHGVLKEGARLLAKPFESSQMLKKIRITLDGD